MKKFGIDISVWQGDFNLERAKRDGVEFVILKGGGGDDGLYVDRRFDENYKKAKSLNMPVGVYWFSRALTINDAKSEADFFYKNCLRGKKFELPVFIDVENRTQLSIGKRMLTDVIKTWCKDLTGRGWYAGIYSSLSYFRSYMYDSELSDFPHWVAQWSTQLDYAHKDICGVWQFGGETNYIRSNKVAGMTCDQDYLLIDYPAYIKQHGLNGYAKSASKPTKNTNVKQEACNVELPILRRGDKSGYVRTAQILLNKYYDAKLTEDGIFGPATEKAVIAYQRNRGLSVDGIIGAQTWKQLLK